MKQKPMIIEISVFIMQSPSLFEQYSFSQTATLLLELRIGGSGGKHKTPHLTPPLFSLALSSAFSKTPFPSMSNSEKKL